MYPRSSIYTNPAAGDLRLQWSPDTGGTSISRLTRKHAADRFRQHIRRSNELHREYVEDERLFRNYESFADWQFEYLLQFFSDLYGEPGYREAIDFIITDLAGANISDRDRDLERAAPAITTMLPLRALDTTASAAELNARVIEANIGICRALLVGDDLPATITERDYFVASRAALTLDESTELVHLTTSVGRTLSSLVRVPMIGRTLRLMRGPARATGFAALQQFLETGYSTFRNIPDIGYFLDVFENRLIEVFREVHTGPLQ